MTEDLKNDVVLVRCQPNRLIGGVEKVRFTAIDIVHIATYTSETGKQLMSSKSGIPYIEVDPEEANAIASEWCVLLASQGYLFRLGRHHQRVREDSARLAKWEAENPPEEEACPEEST